MRHNITFAAIVHNQFPQKKQWHNIICSYNHSSECAGLNNISNGYVKVNSLKINATAIYSCDDGFVLVGESIRVCEDDLTWSGEVPTCLGMMCV